MLAIKLKDRDTKIKGYDYIFADVKNYDKMKPYLEIPKIEKQNWKVAIVELPLDEARVIAGYKELPFLEVDMYLRKDVHIKLLQELRVEVKKPLSSWEKYQLYIAESRFLFDKNSSRELFKRTRGNQEALDEIMSELQSLFFDETKMTTWHLNQVSVREDNVYARDVMLTLLLFNNQHIPKKGSRFSGYKYKKWDALLEKLQDEIGRDAAFFSMRKFIRTLYKDKVKYLNNKILEHKDLEVLRYVDIYEIMYIKNLFETSNPNQTEAIIIAIDGRRTNNVSLFTK